MTDRTIYEHVSGFDYDGSTYWVMNCDVERPYKNPKLYDFVKWFEENDVNNGVYYKLTRLYFTFEGVKYWLSWTFYHKDVLLDAYLKLTQIGAKDILFNLGVLD